MSQNSVDQGEPVLDLSILPEEYRTNWYIVIILRSDAMKAYAKKIASASTNKQENKEEWIRIFDQASNAWCETNPLANNWPYKPCNWPKNAAIYLGKAALEKARGILKVKS